MALCFPTLEPVWLCSCPALLTLAAQLLLDLSGPNDSEARRRQCWIAGVLCWDDIAPAQEQVVLAPDLGVTVDNAGPVILLAGASRSANMQGRPRDKIFRLGSRQEATKVRRKVDHATKTNLLAFCRRF